MDVAYYLSELLGQLGEVNVPGLGYFVHLRVDGYYDNTEGKFHPPGSKLHFDPQYLDDDVLANYIAGKKRISLASSKYFTAKFIDNLRNEAMQKEVPLADLGTLHFDDTKLRFTPSAALTADPAFYGYPEISISKLSSTSIHDQMEAMRPAANYVRVPPLPEQEPAIPLGAPGITEPGGRTMANSHPEVFEPSFNFQPAAEEEFVFQGRTYAGDDEEEGSSRSWIWITIAAVIILVLGGGYFLLKMRPDLLNKLRHNQPAPLALKTQLKHDTVKSVMPNTALGNKADSAKNASHVIMDTTAKTPVAPKNITAVPQNTTASTIDSTKTRYELIGSSAKTLSEANTRIKNYKTLGIDAHILNDAPGKRIKISLGTYSTAAQAWAVKTELVKAGKVKNDVYPLPINPKQ